ncbi:MAG TPA: sugar phosphate nucleotidyltransferase, partial [Actinomycetota bacterium]
GITPLVREFERDRPHCQILLSHVPNPQEFGVAELEGDRIVRLQEKPKDPPTDLALVGVYMFDETVFEAVNAIRPSARNELEITDAIQYLIDSKRDVRSHIITGWWKDTGKLEDLLEANRIMLDRRGRDVRGDVDAESHLVGEVVVEEGAVVRASVIRGPAAIARGAVVERSIVGPYVSVHEGTRIEDTEIRNSIILEGSVISGARPVADSLIGKNVRITKGDDPPAYRLMLGDHSELQLP